MGKILILLSLCVLLLILAISVEAVDIDNDPLIGYRWQPPSNEWAVDHYDVEWWASGFAPQHGILQTDSAFVVVDITPWAPGIAQIDSLKARGVNMWDEPGDWSEAANRVEFHPRPEPPGQPNWVPDNE